ncbi:MAG: DUF4349 domain-containing protein [Novosphingobium sp.]|uniref:DUF4349 domain-containing protein n=1 Tax=Novosphingobium sp. TaxID=1874826 RepID=UPI003B9B4042
MDKRISTLFVLALLTACSQKPAESAAEEVIAQIEPSQDDGDAPQNKFGFQEALQPGTPDLFGGEAHQARMMAVNLSEEKPAEASVNVQPASTASEPQIAYSYGFGFQISGEKVAQLQRAHTAICERMAPKCRVMRTSQASSDEIDAYGEVELHVAATEAGAFEKALSKPATELGGELVSSIRDGEDLSDSIIDTEARLQSRLVLRDKLTEILKNNRGGVEELIAAEKAIADVNEEVDEARSKLQQYRGRIRYSAVKIEYQPYFGDSQLGFGRPILTALRSTKTTIGVSIAAIVYAVAALLPVVLLILALRWMLHRFGMRLRFWKKRSKDEETAQISEAD